MTDSATDPSDVFYPKQPLVEVIFEVRFPGNLNVECEMHKFWEKIKDDYPRTYVPEYKINKASALQPYKFKSEDKNLTVMLAINSFAVSASVYPGFKEFKKEVIRLYKLFSSTYSIKTASRIGWRYINVIPFVREDGVIPLDQFLTLGFKVPKSIPERFTTINMTFESTSKDGASILTKLETVQNRNTQEQALLLDFDYGRYKDGDAGLKFSKTPDYLEEAHGKTRQLFEEFITDDYRQYIKGDAI